jgi:hypothetical protein
MLDQGFYVDATPPQTGEQREVRPAVEGQGPPAPTSAPPHEIAGFLMQPAMLGGRDFAGRALDQRPQVLAGETTDLDAKALGLRVELRPVGETCGRHVEEPKHAAHCRGRLPQTRQTSGRPGFAGPGHHSDIRMTLAICTQATEGIQDAATAALQEAFS